MTVPPAAAQIEFEVAEIRIEVNATDGDAGIQVDLDGEGWEQVTILDPNGAPILEVDADGGLGDTGLTELFFESEEPSFDEVPLPEILARFPEGEYEFVGTTVEGETIVGTAVLTHDIPAAPIVVFPTEGAWLHLRDLQIVWLPVTRPGRIEIVGYQVIVHREEPPIFEFSVDVPRGVHSVTVPDEFLQGGTDYTLEVLAIEASGNQTITEISFRTRWR